jgi:SET domain-containing protein
MLTEIKRSKINGFGVFATEDIEKNTIVEECIVIKDTIEANSKALPKYRFIGDADIDNKEVKFWIILSGNAMIYNSAEIIEDRNLKRMWPYKDRIVNFITTKNIKKGEELLLYYPWK